MIRKRTAVTLLACCVCFNFNACKDDATPSRDVTSLDSARPDRGSDTAAIDRGGQHDQLASTDTRPPSLACSTSLNLAPATLASDLCVALRQDLPATPNSIAFNGRSLLTYSFSASGEIAAHQGEVLEWPVEISTGKLGASSSFFSFSVPKGDEEAYASEFLALSSTGEVAAVGFTFYSIEGYIYWGNRGAAKVEPLAAKGNYDAVLLDDDTLLVNGLGLATAAQDQAVYVIKRGASTARRLIKDMGNLSGNLVLGERTLFVGGYYVNGNRIYGFSRAEILAALAADKELSATSDGDLIYDKSVLDATALGDDLVVARGTTKINAVSLVPVTLNGDSLSAGSVRDIVTPGGNTTIGKLANSSQELCLLLGGSKTEVAVIKRK